MSGIRVAVLVATIVIGFAACGSTEPVPTPPGPSASAVAPSAPIRPSLPPATEGAASTEPAGPLSSTGSIVVLGNDGSLSLVDSAGQSIPLSPADEGTFTFPAWSPDGSQVAAIRYGPTGNAVLIFEADRAPSGEMPEPVVIFESPDIGPFYLSWAPDGGNVSFLATEPNGSLALRLAPADGSAPIDGSGPGATIGTGSPFYFDWIERDLLLAHVGSGPDALLGEIGLDGDSATSATGIPGSPGIFRSAVISPDHRLISYVRLGDGGRSEVVVATRDGSTEHAIPVFGFAAVGFNPRGDTIATIGPVEPVLSTAVLPVGPLRLVDAESGAERVLLGGSVLGFWWSPDGSTIAALRVQPVASQAAARLVVAPGEPAQEVRLMFVDVPSGDIGSEAVVRPGQLFADQLLPFFDQYTLSHDLWAPDSSSFLLPVLDADGATRVAVMYRNGDPPRLIDGAIGFWSP